MTVSLYLTQVLTYLMMIIKYEIQPEVHGFLGGVPGFEALVDLTEDTVLVLRVEGGVEAMIHCSAAVHIQLGQHQRRLTAGGEQRNRAVVVMYGAETWATTKGHAGRTETNEMRMLRWMGGVTKTIRTETNILQEERE